jgi:hypothetical protein
MLNLAPLIFLRKVGDFCVTPKACQRHPEQAVQSRKLIGRIRNRLSSVTIFVHQCVTMSKFLCPIDAQIKMRAKGLSFSYAPAQFPELSACGK